MVAWVLTGCAIRQEVKPVERMESRQICVIEDKTVRASFLESYKKALANKGYYVRQLQPLAALTACPVTSTYSAAWIWDFAPWLDYAEILVYHNGKLAGEARYDARSADANWRRYQAADSKIRALAYQLFPNRLATPAPPESTPAQADDDPD